MIWLSEASKRTEPFAALPRGSIEIRAAHEIMAAGAAKFAFFVVQFVAAAGTPAPVFAGDVGVRDGTGGQENFGLGGQMALWFR
jgi:hypothetical protein